MRVLKNYDLLKDSQMGLFGINDQGLRYHMQQHPTAVIHKATRIAEDVTVGAYAVIEDGVEIGGGTVIREHAVIRSGTVLGRNCHVDSHVVLGGLPQDLSFNPKTPRVSWPGME
jgi:acyl-[acyl carrier protein]--UDP-N-acetylglucosamine O-acyltransferase